MTNTLQGDNAALIEIKEWIQMQTGIHFTNDKLEVLRSRLETLCVRHGYTDLNEMNTLIKQGDNNTLLRRVIEAATTNHTHFYREAEPLQFYQKQIIPELPKNENWRIWSAAASSGEELYTLAMLSIESLGYTHTKNSISFLGTDVNPQVIEQAELGVYAEHRISDLPKSLKQKWFDAVALGSYSIKQELKELCIFRKLNLKCYPWPFTRKFHVIFLRNVLYYFEEHTQREIVNNIYEVTQPGGWLITSVTENLSAYDHPWTKVQAGIYRKQGGAS